MRHFQLPIDDALPSLTAALAPAGAAVVLHAPPGAGKSTAVPLALLDEPWASGGRILMLEPRRLAARAVARRMATMLGDEVGGQVGYRMRLDTRVSARTRIEVVTEGVLTSMLQRDPELTGVRLVIFDEFHERSLDGDVGLALTLDARDALAPDLRLLVMSATLDVEPVAALLGGAAIVRAEGQAWPVETRHAGRGLPQTDREGLAAIVRLVREALAQTTGDLLVFLPGAAEIRRVEAALAEDARPGVRLYPLFGDLDPAAQDAAIRPSADGERRVVLATNIAETSLTIDGVTVVVDSGLVRRAAFDPGSGLTRLVTQRISRASADQRRGRAGRTAPGVCYRAWSEAAQRSLAAATPAEILNADLAPLALELACWGVADPDALRWLDPPPAAAYASARDLLRRLGALDAHGRVTTHGREMAAVRVHPRLAHMLISAREYGGLREAAQLAALVSERDLLRNGGLARGNEAMPAGAAGGAAAVPAGAARGAAAVPARSAREGVARDADMRTRLALLRGDTVLAGVDRGALERARRFARELERRLSHAGRNRTAAALGDAAGVLLAWAYPDRIARRRPGAAARYALSNGRGAILEADPQLARADFIVAIDLDDRERDARIRLAVPLARDDLLRWFADDIEETEAVEWNAREQAVTARRTRRFDALVLDEVPLPDVPGSVALAAMLEGVATLGLESLPWNDDARTFVARIELVRRTEPDASAHWPAFDDATLLATLDDWLVPWLEGVTRREHLAKVPLVEALKARLGRAELRALDSLAPEWLEVPSGSRVRIDYLDDSAPVVAVKLQEVFGLEQTPHIVGGRVPVTFKLLSPAQRPVQITRDLASFWNQGYADVRKDLRGRYPKHDWPQDPRTAQPSRGPRRRRGSGQPHKR